MTNETTPDAVELLSALLGEMLDGLVVPPTEAIERRDRLYRARNALLAERARHAEEVAELEKRVAYVHGILMNTARERNVAQEEITGDATVEASKTPKGNPTPTEPDAPMYVPPDSAPVLQSLIEESAKLGHWALHEQLRAVLASVEGERARHAEEVARLEASHLSDLETIEAWKLASGLECGGDPDGVTPAGMRRYWEGVEADRDSLRAQLRRAEGERDAERKHATEMEERALDLVRDLRLAQAELHALRALLPDVRACAEYCRNILIGPPGMPVEDYPLAPVALAARRILAALDQKETPTP